VGEFVYLTASALTGQIADARGSLDWLFAVDAEGAPDNEAFLRGAAVLVEGSTTYEWVLAAERLIERPARWQELFGERPTYVFTSRELPRPAGADVRFAHGAVGAWLAQITSDAAGGDVWIVGGGELAAQFADAGALDRITIQYAPATLAAGAPLFPRDLGPERLALDSVERHGAFVQASYLLVGG
jgi:dihydrofolate reductase